MNLKDRVMREAKAAGVSVYYSDMGRPGVEIVKVPGKKIYLICLSEGEQNKSWVLTSEGIVEYNDPQESVTAFISLHKVASIPFARKSTQKKAFATVIKKTASRTKIACDLGDGDPWITDASQLISKSSKELWALTGDGKYLARLFDENEFPIKSQ